VETTGSSILFWLGVLACAGLVLFAISRGGRRPLALPDHYRAALNYLVHNDEDAALDSLQRTIRSGQAPPDAYIKLGNLLRRRGEHMAAFQIHQTLTVRQDLSDEERTTNLRSLVEDYRALGQRAEALRTLESLAGLRRDPEVLRELARENLLAGNHDAAVTTLREAQRLDASIGKPELAAFLAVLGERELQRDRPAEAKRFLQQALKEDAACSPALLLMGELVSREGDHESALYYWQKLAFAGADGLDVHEKLEKVYFELGKFGEIERVYAQILEKRPRDLQTMLAAGRIALKKGEIGEAEQLLRAALEFAPQSTAAFLMLVNLYLDEGKSREVRELVTAHVDGHRRSEGFECRGCGARRPRPAGYCLECGRFWVYRPV
jgi:lipopolysaccharide biosynthesis regulator YciM